MQEQAKPNTPEKRVFRIIVSNASEAVSIIQKKFGTNATVQSVKQHQPKGVTKLWSNPKLEIIVAVPTNPEAGAAFQLPQSEETSETKEPETKETVSEESAMPDVEDVTRPSNKGEESAKKPDSTGSESEKSILSGSNTLTLEEILLQSEFDKTVVQRLKNLPQWNTFSQRSTKQGLTEVIAILREEFLAAQTQPVGSHIAFIGTSGVGKSTILRKTIANHVFVHGKKAQVLKLDDDDPNPDDMLSVFCEVIGVELVRDPNDLRLEKDTEIFVDLPGVNLNSPETIRKFKNTLDDLKIASRVLVMNSLYDTRTLTNAYDLGRVMGATHQTFTHLDELESWAKLWKFVMKGSYPLIFLNMGDESSAAPKEEFLPLLVSKTFPKILLN